MNKLKILLLTTALITGSSALASAEEHRDGWRNQNRYSDHDRDDRYRNNGYYNNGYYNNGYYNNGHYNNGHYNNGYYGNGSYGNGYYGDGDHDRDDRYRGNYVYQNNRRWRDRDQRWNYRGR